MREISNSTITSGIIEKNNNQWPSSTLVSGLYYLHIEAVPGTCIGIGFGNNSSIEGLTGEYIVTKFTQPLTYNGTMQITAVKAVPYLGLYQNQGG